MEDYERAHYLEQMYLMEQEWEMWEHFNKGRKSSMVERGRRNKSVIRGYIHRCKCEHPQKIRGRKAKP